MNLVFAGIWVCLVTLGAGYGAAIWRSGQPIVTQQKPGLKGLQFVSLPTISVPIIANGKIDGYVVGKFVYTADSGTLHAMSIPPDAFLIDEIFRIFYTEGRVDFRDIHKYDLDQMLLQVIAAVNKRLSRDVVQDILVEGLNYIDPAAARSGAAGVKLQAIASSPSN